MTHASTPTTTVAVASSMFTVRMIRKIVVLFVALILSDGRSVVTLKFVSQSFTHWHPTRTQTQTYESPISSMRLCGGGGGLLAGEPTGAAPYAYAPGGEITGGGGMAVDAWEILSVGGAAAGDDACSTDGS